jgi:dephospho-CoA kinase
MVIVGLTGGIGSGKSTVARMLEQRGAVVIDADDLARRAVEPGTHGYAEVIRAFGPDALTVSGDLDRAWLARKVFKDADARKALEAIVQPEVGQLFAEEAERHRGTDRILVYAVPLLIESHLEALFDVVITVEAPEDVRVARLASDREMTEEAARDRIRAQASDAERRAAAHMVIRNEGSLSDLESTVDNVWRGLVARADGPKPPSRPTEPTV